MTAIITWTFLGLLAATLLWLAGYAQGRRDAHEYEAALRRLHEGCSE